MMAKTAADPSPGRQTGALPTRAVVQQSIAQALDKLHGPEHRARMGSAMRGPGLVQSAIKEGREPSQAEHLALAADLLHQAQAALEAQPPDALTVGGFIDNDDIALSLVLSRIAEK